MAKTVTNYFMINLHENYAAELGFELSTSESAVRHSVMETRLLLDRCLVCNSYAVPYDKCMFSPRRVLYIIKLSPSQKSYLGRALRKHVFEHMRQRIRTVCSGFRFPQTESFDTIKCFSGNQMVR